MPGKLSEEQRADYDLITPMRWRELYWGPRSGYPSQRALARRLSCSENTVHRRLLAAGLLLRTISEQKKIDDRLGRRAKPRIDKEQWRKNLGRWNTDRRATLAAHLHTPEIKARAHAARRERIQTFCFWCGECMERVPHDIRTTPHPCCSVAHRSQAANHLRWRGGDYPRPLILERLRDLMKHPNGIPIAHPTREQLEKAAATIGAREPEIEAVLLESIR